MGLFSFFLSFGFAFYAVRYLVSSAIFSVSLLYRFFLRLCFSFDALRFLLSSEDIVDMDGIKNSPGIERASLFERAVAEGDVGVDMGEDISLGSQDGGKREVNGSEKTSYDMYISPRALGTNYEEGNSKISRMMGSLSLPPELTSFALTYEKAYCSSLFMDCWTSERTLSRIDMPIRMRPQNQRPQKQATKFECLTW